MATKDEQIRDMLLEELKKNKDATTAFLQEKATEIKKAVAKLSLRSFHGTYVGSVKRMISGKKGGRKKAGSKQAAPKVQMTSDLRSSINSLIDKQIKDARASLDKTLDARLKKARKLNRIEDFEKIHDALVKAREML